VEAHSQISQADEADGGIAIAEYSHLVDDAFVRRLGECCGVAPENWGQEFCTSLVDNSGGFQARLGTIGSSIANGKVTLDQTKAAACIATASSMDCTSLDGTTSRAWWDDCLGAIEGTVATSGACAASVECIDGYCASGTCAPLVTGACTTSDACSRWGGAFGSFCSAGTCTAPYADGHSCHDNGVYGNNQCAGTLCNGGGGCVDSISIASPGLCAFCTL
jgi:hypothetical protein